MWQGTGSGTRKETTPHSHEYYVDDSRIANRFGHRLEPLWADWIDLALAVYLADRLALRQHPAAPRRMFQWQRSFRVRLPVRVPEVWKRSGVFEALEQLLSFLTEDHWQIEFVPRNASKRSSESQSFLFPYPPPAPLKVALFSGGLDSFAGAAQQLADFPHHSFVFVSGMTNGRQRAGQREQVEALAKAHDRHIWHVLVPYGLRWLAPRSRRPEESSQRTRGFLFLTLGAVSALAAVCNELAVYENGIGAINLPYDGTQIGTSNSRSVHPVTIRLMARFIESLTGKVVHISQPFLFHTKAEMCRHPAVQSLREHIDLTFSCDAYPVQVSGKAQCGYCTSCLLRRQALEAAGLSASDRAGYLRNLCSLNPLKEHHLTWLRAMEWQYWRLSNALAQQDSWRALSQEFVELRQLVASVGRLPTADSIDWRNTIIRLYSNYVAEWSAFSARAVWLLNRRTA